MKTSDLELQAELSAIYDQIMWLAKRPNVTPTDARAWYTHIMAEKVKRKVRRFSGRISKAASTAPETAPLRLEHYKRIQKTLTDLVTRHSKLKKGNPSEFIRVVLKCERVHIVTFKENYDAMHANGNYRKAGIELVSWKTLSSERRRSLWRKMLRGRVANADKFES